MAEEGHHHSTFCLDNEASYSDRVFNKDQHNFCAVPERGFDAVLFVAVGVICTCLAPRKHYAIVMLVVGALVQLLNINVNIREMSNALNLWIGIRPAKMFFYIFLPPLLLDSAVRIDFFVFRKVMSQVFVFAFGVVACNTVLLAVFMLYVLNLRNEGWEWTDAFLFACMIASTDALAVTAIMKDGSGPESLVILAEGESLFNDATSIVFFDLFWPRFKDSIDGTLKHESVPAVVGKMALDVLWLAFGGALIGIASGILTRLLFKYLQNCHGHSPVSEVGITLGVAYLCYYMAESVVEVSGVIAVVVYGLYGAATTQWEISPSARESKVFSSFWDVTQLLTNGIVFFYAGASATNFFYRCEEDLFEGPNDDAWSTLFGWLPGVYIGIFLLRFLEIAIVSPIVGYFDFKLKINEIIFISLAGLRGALALILAQELLQYEFPHDGRDFKTEKKVRAQSALWVCGFVLLTLVINAPGIPFLLKVCGLEQLTPIQLEFRKKSEEALKEFTESTLDEMKADTITVVRGVDWKEVEAFVFGHAESHGATPATGGRQNEDDGVEDGVVDQHWDLGKSIRQPPSVPAAAGSGAIPVSSPTQSILKPSVGAPLGGSYRDETVLVGKGEQDASTEPILSAISSKKPTHPTTDSVGVANAVWLAAVKNNEVVLLKQGGKAQDSLKKHIKAALYPAKESGQKHFVSSRSLVKLYQKESDFVRVENDDTKADDGMSSVSQRITIKYDRSVSRRVVKESDLTKRLLEPDSEAAEIGIDEYETEKLKETRFRLLMGLKKYFHERRTEGFLTAQALRLLEWACDRNMDNPDWTLQVWKKIEEDLKSRMRINLSFRVRYFLRRASLDLKSWPPVIEMVLSPMLDGVSRFLSWLLTGDFRVLLDASIEYWIGLNTYRAHSSWLVNPETAQDMAREIEEELQAVWTFILDREIESPERFDAIQTYRAKRVIIQSQMGFVDELFDNGLLEENEHEHLKHDLEHKRAHLTRVGPILHNIDVAEFLQNHPCFANVSSTVFRKLIANCQLQLHKHKDTFPDEPEISAEAFSFHIVVNGSMRTRYTTADGICREYHLGRGGMFGLWSALSGEQNKWLGYADINALGHGPTFLTVPHSALMEIRDKANKGELQYQQLLLNLFRMSALYMVEYMKEELLEILAVNFSEQPPVVEMSRAHRRKEKSSRQSSPSPSALSVLQVGGKHAPSGPSAQGTSDGAKGEESMKDIAKKSVEIMGKIKMELLRGELVLVSPNGRFLQTSSVVLMIGSMAPRKGDDPGLKAPAMIPWAAPDDASPVEYVAGAYGAVLVSCVGEGVAIGVGSSVGPGSIGDGAYRFGADTAPLPISAANVHKELLH